MPRKGQPAKINHPWHNRVSRHEVGNQVANVGHLKRTKAVCPYCEMPDDLPHADECPIK